MWHTKKIERGQTPLPVLYTSSLVSFSIFFKLFFFLTPRALTSPFRGWIKGIRDISYISEGSDECTSYHTERAGLRSFARGIRAIDHCESRWILVLINTRERGRDGRPAALITELPFSHSFRPMEFSPQKENENSGNARRQVKSARYILGIYIDTPESRVRFPWLWLGLDWASNLLLLASSPSDLGVILWR